MNDADDDVKDDGDEQPQSQEAVADTKPPETAMTAVVVTQCTDDDGGEPADGRDDKNSLRLLGEPLVTHGPYAFFGALAYRKRNGAERRRRRRRWKKLDNGKLADCGGDSCCCDLDDSSWSCSEWSAVRMNHFYPVRPWYSKQNSSSNNVDEHEQQKLRQRTKSTKDSSEHQHHYQQSVCIGELELLWRDDTVQTIETLEKRGNGNNSRTIGLSNEGETEGATGVPAAGSSEDEETSSSAPRRRQLPRRTRQPSAKKLEAAESYLAAATAAVAEHSPQSPTYRRLPSDPGAQSNTVHPPAQSPADPEQYAHGNVLCSVRLYVMPDQTAAGRLSGVHGEDEVLEINTWTGATGMAGAGVDGNWPSCNAFVNGGLGPVYNGGGGGGGGDDFGYGSGGHSSGIPTSTGCTGLVLRAEDFVEWVRGGLLNDDDDMESDDESSESSTECEGKLYEKIKIENEQSNSQLSSSTIGRFENSKASLDTAKTEEVIPLSVDLDKVKKEQAVKREVDLDRVVKGVSEDVDKKVIDVKKQQLDVTSNDHYSKSTAINKAVEMERVPLAAARIPSRRKPHHLRTSETDKSLVNGETIITKPETTTDKGSIYSLDYNFFLH